jgi:hypothetical protein
MAGTISFGLVVLVLVFAMVGEVCYPGYSKYQVFVFSGVF